MYIVQMSDLTMFRNVFSFVEEVRRNTQKMPQEHPREGEGCEGFERNSRHSQGKALKQRYYYHI